MISALPNEEYKIWNIWRREGRRKEERKKEGGGGGGREKEGEREESLDWNPHYLTPESRLC